MLSFLKNLFTTYLEYDILLYYKLFLPSLFGKTTTLQMGKK